MFYLVIAKFLPKPNAKFEKSVLDSVKKRVLKLSEGKLPEVDVYFMSPRSTQLGGWVAIVEVDSPSILWEALSDTLYNYFEYEIIEPLSSDKLVSGNLPEIMPLNSSVW